MSKKNMTITFVGEQNENVDFSVIEETTLNGTTYLLVSSETEDEDVEEAIILKEVDNSRDSDAVYEIVEDENELDAVSMVFEELLSDTDIELS